MSSHLELQDTSLERVACVLAALDEIALAQCCNVDRLTARHSVRTCFLINLVLVIKVSCIVQTPFPYEVTVHGLHEKANAAFSMEELY